MNMKLAIEEMTGVSKEDITEKGEFAYGVPFYGEPRLNFWEGRPL